MSVIKRESRTAWPTFDYSWPEERVDRMFRDMFRDFFTGRALGERFAEGMANPLHLEEYVEDGSCVIRAELPGLDPDKDVEITVDDGVLTMSAHREARKEEERPDAYRSEFHYGSFTRTVRLPQGVKESDITATYKDGILEIRVPIEAATPAPKTVAVQRG